MRPEQDEWAASLARVGLHHGRRLYSTGLDLFRRRDTGGPLQT